MTMSVTVGEFKERFRLGRAKIVDQNVGVRHLRDNSATARPMPAVLPVTMAFRPLRSIIMINLTSVVFNVHVARTVSPEPARCSFMVSSLIELYQVLKQKSALLAVRNVQGCTALIEPSEFNRSEAESRDKRCDRCAGIRVIA